MKHLRFLLPTALCLAASAAFGDTVNIPLPPPTPLNPDATNAGGPSGVAPTATVATKKAADYSDDELRAMGTGVAFPYELLDSALHRFVSGKGEFYYLKAKDDNDLATFARAVAIADMGQFPIFTSPKDPQDLTKGTVPDTSAELTFWINAYNGLRIKAITDLYPLPGSGTPRDFDTAKTQTVAGKNYSFAQLRDKIGKMDPRALFALMSGSLDGPGAPLAVYRYSRLNLQLEGAAKAFVNDPNKVSVPDRLANRVEVSPYLQMVDGYFKPKGGRRKYEGIRQVLGSYATNPGSRNYFATSDYTINFSLSNSKLNEQIAGR